MAVTRDALQAYAHVLGACLKQLRPRRKHWWHASLRPSLNGLTTGIVRGRTDFELELSLRDCLLLGRSSCGNSLSEPLVGQSAADIVTTIATFLAGTALDEDLDIDADQQSYDGFESQLATKMMDTISFIAAALEKFRAGIREETSPVQLWPHHFDLSMIWLPGPKVQGQDPGDEEYADKQMNFGFAFGDEGIPEPYFYVTAYPLPPALPNIELPSGTSWRSEGFSGAVLLYRTLIERSDPQAYLLDVWSRFIAVGREHWLTDDGAQGENHER